MALVNVGELGEDRQVVLSGFLAIVRLLPLDEFPCFPARSDAVQGTRTPRRSLGRPNDAVEVVRVGVDGELVPTVRSVAFRKHELPDEVIQGGTQIMNGIAADDAEKQWNRVFDYREGSRRAMFHRNYIDDLVLGVRF